MKIFEHSKVYLCGQVEMAEDCRTWRRDIAQALILNVDPTIVVWDPLIKPKWMSDDSRHPSLVLSKREIFNWTNEAEKDVGARAWSANAEIRRICKQLAGKCDWMIARITKDFTWGSIDELEIAINRGIPIFFWFPDGPLGVYGLPASINFDKINDYVFRNNSDLINKLRTISIEGIPSGDDEKWMFRSYKNAVDPV